MSSKMNKRVMISALLLVMILMVGCPAKKDGAKSQEEFRTGTQGLVLNFLPNHPQDKYIVGDSEEEIDVVIDVKNKGSFPETSGQIVGRIWLSGFDTNILDFEKKDIPLLNVNTLQGKSILNPQGGFESFELKGKINPSNLKIDKYTPTLLATTCYDYETVASPTVCIDHDPFSDEKKVCKVSQINLQSQGAPVAITRIEEEVLGKTIQFKIFVKNVGGGDVIEALSQIESCNPYGEKKLDRKQLDKIKISKVSGETISIGNKPLSCRPLTTASAGQGEDYMRLFNGEGFIICSIDKDQLEKSTSGYTTPLTIPLSYTYRTTISKPIEITKIPSGESE